MTLKVRILLFSTFYSKTTKRPKIFLWLFFIVLWPYLSTTKLRCLQKNNIGYTWQVADDYAKVNYGQKETRDGATTAGSYFVLLPDGRTQKVAYTVDAYGGRNNLFVTSKNETRNSPIHEFNVLHRGQRAF